MIRCHLISSVFIRMLLPQRVLQECLAASGLCNIGRPNLAVFHINLWELFPIILAVEILADHMANQRILFLSENEATVYVINKMSSKDPVMWNLSGDWLWLLWIPILFFDVNMYLGKQNISLVAFPVFLLQVGRIWAPWLDSKHCVLPSALLRFEPWCVEDRYGIFRPKH